MSSIRKKTTMIATLAAIFSLTMGFMPQSDAGSIPLSLNLGLVCGVSIPTTPIALAGSPTATGNFQLENTGNGVQDVDANVGLGFFGQETPTPILHLPSSTTSLDATSTGLTALGPIQMSDDGTVGIDTKFAELVGQGGASTVTIAVDISSPINPPFSGQQDATLAITADIADCHA